MLCNPFVSFFFPFDLLIFHPNMFMQLKVEIVSHGECMDASDCFMCHVGYTT